MGFSASVLTNVSERIVTGPRSLRIAGVDGAPASGTDVRSEKKRQGGAHTVARPPVITYHWTAGKPGGVAPISRAFTPLPAGGGEPPIQGRP